jgi:hypothetical protein
MTKITVSIPDPIIDHIRETLKVLLESPSVSHSKRELVVWAIEQFAQSRPPIRSILPDQTSPSPAVDAADDEIMSVVTIDVPDELFRRVDMMWKEFVHSTRITLSKRKLVLWALEQFVRSNNQKYERTDPL